MATGYFVIYLTPGGDVLTLPEGWEDRFLTGATVIVDRDTIHLWDLDDLPDPLPDPPPGEWLAETRDIARARYTTIVHGEPAVNHSGADNALRPVDEEGNPTPERAFRLRGPVEVEQEAGGKVRLFVLRDDKLPAAWGNQAVFWGVFTTVANHKTLHEYIYTTLGFAPAAGALAALDPDDQTHFLDHAIQTATELTNQQQLQRVTAIRNALNVLGYTPTELTKIVNSPAGKTEDDLMRAIVHDLGFTMRDLQQVAMAWA